MSWSDVGGWLKDNAGSGVKIVGSLLTGNVAGAVAMGASLVSSATGSSDPDEALAVLKNDAESMLRLKELYYKNEESVRVHTQEMLRLELEDKQHEHEQTQTTIRNGDNQDGWVKAVRPGHSTISLIGAIAYVFMTPAADLELTILAALLTLPTTYAGLRGVDKSMLVWKGAKEKSNV